MLPETIADASPLDPLLLLPLPSPLPANPSTHLAALAPLLTSPSLPLPVLAASARGANRSAQVLLNAARTGAAEARAHLDEVDVGLRTAEYELARVRDEMARCMEYEPMYESMDMPDEEGVLASASDEVLAGLPSDPEARHYALITLRLESELAAVLAAEERLAALTAERDGLVRARREVKAKFDAVDVWLRDYAKTSTAMATKIRDVVRVPSARGRPEEKEPEKDKEKGERMEGVEAETAETGEDVPAGAPAA